MITPWSWYESWKPWWSYHDHAMGRDDHGKKHDRHAVIMAWSWTCFAMIMVWSWQDHAMAAMIFQSGRRTQKPIKERLKKVMPVDFYISVTCDKEAWCDFTKKIVEPTLFVSRTRLSRMRIFFGLRNNSRYVTDHAYHSLPYMEMNWLLWANQPDSFPVFLGDMQNSFQYNAWFWRCDNFQSNTLLAHSRWVNSVSIHKSENEFGLHKCEKNLAKSK